MCQALRSRSGYVLLKQHLAKHEKVALGNREHLKTSGQVAPQIITLQKPGKQTGLGRYEKVFRYETVKEVLRCLIPLEVSKIEAKACVCAHALCIFVCRCARMFMSMCAHAHMLMCTRVYMLVCTHMREISFHIQHLPLRISPALFEPGPFTDFPGPWSTMPGASVQLPSWGIQTCTDTFFNTHP